MLFCGIDIGTTNIKAVLLNGNGAVLDYVTITSGIDQSCQNVHAEQWYESFSRIMDQFCARSRAGAKKIYCSVTSQGGTVVFLNKDLLPAGPPVSWVTSAHTSVVQELVDEFGEHEYYHITGWNPDSWLAACKLREMIREHKLPETTQYITSIPDYLYARLTGQLMTDVTNAQITGLADFRKSEWHQGILEWAGVDTGMLPEVVNSLKVVFDNIQTRWGNLNLVTSSHDQYAAMHAARLRKDNDLMLGTGTAWVLNTRTSSPVFDDDAFSAHPGRDVIGESFGNICTLGPIGADFDRLLKRLNVSYEQLTEIEAAFDMMTAPCRTLCKEDIMNASVDDDSDILIKHYMEWSAAVVAYSLNNVLPGNNSGRIIMTGGTAVSKVWPRIIANVCNREVIAIDSAQFTAYGAALHAMSASGHDLDITSAPKPYSMHIFKPQINNEYHQWYESVQQNIFLQSQSGSDK